MNTFIKMCIYCTLKGDLLEWLSGFGLVVQQWLSHSGENENPVVVQPLRLDSAAAPVWSWKPEGFPERCWSLVCAGTPEKLILILMKDGLSNSLDGLASKDEDQQLKQFPFSMSFYPGCHQKVLPTFRLGLPASDNLIKTTLHRQARQLTF